MSGVTKLALQQANTRLARENDALRHEVAQLKADLLRVTECASAVNTMQRPFGGQETPRLKAMREAREIAMATGRTTKVQNL